MLTREPEFGEDEGPLVTLDVMCGSHELAAAGYAIQRG